MLRVRCRAEPGMMPSYESDQAAGADLRASLPRDIVLRPGERAVVGTGVRIQLPAGYEAQVRPRSGLAARNGVTLLNAPGTVDADYRGEIRVVLVNLGEAPFVVCPGMRIAQLVVAPVVRAEFLAVHELESTERGEAGFGSTGI